jgi:hypothetical protein
MPPTTCQGGWHILGMKLKKLVVMVFSHHHFPKLLIFQLLLYRSLLSVIPGGPPPVRILNLPDAYLSKDGAKAKQNLLFGTG